MPEGEVTPAKPKPSGLVPKSPPIHVPDTVTNETPPELPDSGGPSLDIGAIASATVIKIEAEDLFNEAQYGPLPQDHVGWLKSHGARQSFDKYITEQFGVSRPREEQQGVFGGSAVYDMMTQLFAEMEEEAKRKKPNHAKLIALRAELRRIMSEQTTQNQNHENAKKQYETEKRNAAAQQKTYKQFEHIPPPLRSDMYIKNKTSRAFRDVNEQVHKYLLKESRDPSTSKFYANLIDPHPMSFSEGKLSAGDGALLGKQGMGGRSKKLQEYRPNKLAENQMKVDRHLRGQMRKNKRFATAYAFIKKRNDEHQKQVRSHNKNVQQIDALTAKIDELKKSNDAEGVKQLEEQRGALIKIEQASLKALDKSNAYNIRDPDALYDEEFAKAFPQISALHDKSTLSREDFYNELGHIGRAFQSVREQWGDHTPIHQLSKLGFYKQKAERSAYKSAVPAHDIKRHLQRRKDLQRWDKLRDIMQIMERFGHAKPTKHEHAPVYSFMPQVPMQLSKKTKALAPAIAGTERRSVVPTYVSTPHKKYVGRLSNLSESSANIPPQLMENLARHKLSSADLRSYAEALGVKVPTSRYDDKTLATNPEFKEFIETLQTGQKGDPGFKVKASNVFRSMRTRDLNVYNALMHRLHDYRKLGITHRDITAFAEGEHEKYHNFDKVLSRERKAQIDARKWADVSDAKERIDKITGQVVQIPEMIAKQQQQPVVGIQLLSPAAKKGQRSSILRYDTARVNLRKSQATRYDWRPLALHDPRHSNILYDGSQNQEFERRMKTTFDRLEQSGVGVGGTTRDRPALYSYIGNLYNQEKYGLPDSSERQRLQAIKTALGNPGTYLTNRDKQKNEQFLRDAADFNVYFQLHKNGGFDHPSKFRPHVDYPSLHRYEGIISRKQMQPMETQEEKHAEKTPAVRPAVRPAARQPSPQPRPGPGRTETPALTLAEVQEADVTPRNLSRALAAGQRPPTATRSPPIRRGQGGFGPIRHVAAPRFNLRQPKNFLRIPDIMHSSLRTSVSAQAIEAPAYRRDETNVTDLVHSFGKLSVQPKNVGRVHIVTPTMHVPGHMLHDVWESVNMGRQQVEAAHRKTGPFAARKGRSKIMSQSANVVNRSRGKIFETTINRKISNFELHRLFKKIGFHTQKAVGSILFMVFNGTKKLIGDLHSIDMEDLKRQIRKKLTKHAKIGLEIVDAKSGGALHNPTLHTPEFHLSLM